MTNCQRFNRFLAVATLITQKHVPDVLYKKDVIKNFAKFTGNTCVGVSSLTKLQVLGLQLY